MRLEFKSYLKTAGGGEGDRCNYPTRLDTYGKGCANNCAYCYARYLLDFRNLWHPDNPSVADIRKIRRTIDRDLKTGDVVRLGGMTDCFQSIEKELKVTYETVKALNDKGVHYLIVTKNPLVADYMDVLDPELAHIQVSITTTDNELNRTYESAEPYSERKRAVEMLFEAGYDVQVRLSPYIPSYVDFDELATIRCDKLLVEFLRANSFVKKVLDIDYSKFERKEGNYAHLPLYNKVMYLREIKGFEQMSVCDDVPSHYKYFKDNFNYNPDDCCNLRLEME